MGRRAGFTLLDMVIAATLLVVVVALAYPGFEIANDTIRTGGLRDRMERAGERLLKTVIEELRTGRVTGLAAPPAPPAITVVRPRSGVDLAELDEEGSVPWRDAADARTIRFRRTRVLTEAAAGQDLNRDGDRNDSFALGVLEVVHGAEVRPITETARVMLALPDHAGDLDGDGVGDPLFTRDGRSVRVRIQLLIADEGHRLLTTVLRGGVRLRNHQE